MYLIRSAKEPIAVGGLFDGSRLRHFALSNRADAQRAAQSACQSRGLTRLAIVKVSTPQPCPAPVETRHGAEVFGFDCRFYLIDQAAAAALNRVAVIEVDVVATDPLPDFTRSLERLVGSSNDPSVWALSRRWQQRLQSERFLSVQEERNWWSCLPDTDNR